MADELSWSPPTSRFQTEKERRFTESRLTYADGMLHWQPAGMKADAVGGTPWTIKVGRGPNEAAELIWVNGPLAPSRGGAITVNVVAVAADDPSGPGGRRVLGYLPADLVRPYMAGGDPEGTHDVTAHTAESIAEAVGLRYSEFEAHMGVDIGKDFPGAIKGSRFIAFSPWILALIYFAFGIAFIVIASGASAPPGFPRFMQVFMIAAGAFSVLASVALTPPMLRWAARRKSARQ